MLKENLSQAERWQHKWANNKGRINSSVVTGQIRRSKGGTRDHPDTSKMTCCKLGETGLQAEPIAKWLDKHTYDDGQGRGEGCGGWPD